MSTDSTLHIPARLQALAATAMLLERLDHLPRTASAAQYQSLVRQLGLLLDQAEGEPSLPALLDSLPGLAELHENLHYAQTGLGNASPRAAMRSERITLELLQRLRRRH